MKSIDAVKNQQRIIIAVIVFALLLVGFLGYLIFLKPGAKKESPKEATPTAFVTITDKGFDPQTILINKGETVSWTNEDIKAHQPASNPHPVHNGLPGFDAKKPLKKCETYQFTFEEAGTFGYHDHLTPTANGSVVVR